MLQKGTEYFLSQTQVYSNKNTFQRIKAKRLQKPPFMNVTLEDFILVRSESFIIHSVGNLVVQKCWLIEHILAMCFNVLPVHVV